MDKLNSLQKNTSSFKEKLAEIKLITLHPQNKNKVFVLLEGEDDIKLFRSILPNKYTDTTGCSGKVQVIKILTILNEEGLCNVIGICDADFDHLNATNNYPDNLFITDYHDMEVQMIESDGFKAIVAEYSSDMCYKKLRANIYDIAIDIGYIRWFNCNGNHNLNFKSLNLKQFIQNVESDIRFDFDYFLTKLFERSEIKNISDSLLKSELKKLKEKSNDPLQICNGHDLTKIIAIIFKQQIKYKNLEEWIRISYGLSYFKKTQLFLNLEQWANSNNFKIFSPT